MPWTRREVVGAAGACVVGGFAGCSSSDGGVEQPDADWSFTPVAGQPDQLTVLYEGGDGITSDNTQRIVIEVNGETEETLEPPIETRGESVRINATSGDTVTIVWVAPDEETRNEMTTYDV